MVTLSIIVIDMLIKLTRVALTRVFITAAWLQLDEDVKWKQARPLCCASLDSAAVCVATHA